MVQGLSEVDRLRSENERLRRALAQAGHDADTVAAERADSDARQGADLAISKAETSVARGEARRARGAATSAASALATSQALVDALRTRDRRQAALIELAESLRDLTDTSAIVRTGMEIAAKAIDASRAAYGIVDDVLRAGDTLVVWKLDRLASSPKMLITSADVARRGIVLVILTESLDTTTPGGTLACADEGMKVADVIDEDAVDLLATKLRMPLQIEMHLELAFEAACRAGARPVPLEIVDSVVSRTIVDLEPRLIRNGHDATTLAREFGAKPGEIRTFLSDTLGADRTRELTDQMRAAGVPL